MSLISGRPLLPARASHDRDAAFRQGLAALDNGHEAEALAIIEPATQVHPDDARLWQVRGLLHRALDDLAPAMDAFARAATLAPADPRIAQGHAHAVLEAGRPAVHLFEKALALAPQDLSIRPGLASALFAEQGIAAAVEMLESQVRQAPSWLAGHWLLARLKWMAGDRSGFTAAIEQAIAKAPRDLSLWQHLVFVLMHAGLYEQALAVIGRGRAAAGAHPSFDFGEAACLTETWQMAAADRAFAALPPAGDAATAIHEIRHLLRARRPDRAVAKAAPIAATQERHLVIPYVATAWRMLGDPRWPWLEGDERLVGIYDLASDLPDLCALAERLRSLHVAVGQPLEQSVRGGTQTDGPLLARIEPEIRALRQTIVRAVERHIARLPPRDVKHPFLVQPRDRRVRFGGSWSVRLTGEGHHIAHVHPAGWMSSALYVGLPSEADRGPAPAGWLALGQPQEDLKLGLEPVRLIEPKPGRLVLFPSTMWHNTIAFDAGERLTVAFDIAPPV